MYTFPPSLLSTVGIVTFLLLAWVVESKDAAFEYLVLLWAECTALENDLWHRRQKDSFLPQNGDEDSTFHGAEMGLGCMTYWTPRSLISKIPKVLLAFLVEWTRGWTFVIHFLQNYFPISSIRPRTDSHAGDNDPLEVIEGNANVRSRQGRGGRSRVQNKLQQTSTHS